jgi:tetratricopeptide (TPR) repeat protein
VKRFAQAVRTLESARELAPAGKEVLAALEEARGGLEAEAAQKKQLADYKASMAAGRAALAEGRFADAVRDFLAAKALMPDDLEAQHGLKQAETKIAGLADKEKRQKAFDGLLERARKAQGATRFNDAVAALEAALRIAPDDREAQRLLRAAKESRRKARSENANLLAQADQAVKLSRLDEARDLCGQAVKNWAEDTQAEKARRAVTRLLDALKVTQAAYLRNMQQGALALATSQYAAAVTAYAEALRLVPGDAEAARQLKLARAALKRDVEARAEYDRLMRRGNAALARRAYGDAVTAFSGALRALPEDAAAAAGLSKARYGKAMFDGQRGLFQKRRADAVGAFEAALAERPDDPAAKLGLRQAKMLR